MRPAQDFGRLLVVVMLWLATATAAWAQDAAAPGGETTSTDPLAWRRVDQDALPVSVVVENRATGQTRRVAGRPLLHDSQELYLSSATVADLFRAGRLWQAAQRRLTLQVQDVTFGVVAGSRLVDLPAGETLLAVPVLYVDGDLWLPLAFVTDVLGPQTRQTVVWRPETGRLLIGAPDANVTGLRVTELTRATGVHLLCTEVLSFRASSPEAGVIEVKIYGGTVDPGRVSLGSRRGLVEAVTSQQHEGFAVVSVRVDDLVTRYRTYTEQDGREIVLVVEEQQVGALPEPVPRGRAELALESGPVDVSLVTAIETVVIDPGHGGVDAGVLGPDGIQEKTVNLQVARELARYLRRQADVDVVLTRDEDVHLPLAERAELANNAGGNLFVSLHCNGWFSEGARGLETYFLSPAETDWTQSVQSAENDVPGGEPADVDFIVWDLVQNRFINHSSDLAEVIQNSVSASLGLPNRGVRQAGFKVLVGAYMPAVLVEMGFLSNPEEEARLSSESYQRQLAHAIGDAILKYRQQVALAARRAAADGEGGR